LEAACATAHWVQESAPEDLGLKQKLLSHIDRSTPPKAHIASSSSGYIPKDLVTECENKDRVLVAHPFNPVYLLPAVELVSHVPDKLQQAVKFYEGIGMSPLVLKKTREGYIADRLMEALWRESLHLVNDGMAETKDIDQVMTDSFGMRYAFMGPFETFLLAGGKGGMRHFLDHFGPHLEAPWTSLKAPALTQDLIDKICVQTDAQLGARSIRDLCNRRDQYLVDLLALKEKNDNVHGKEKNSL